MGDDLISRSKLLEELNNFSMRITGSANAMALVIMEETKKSITKMIDEQPTAFDLKNVTRQIKNLIEPTEQYRHRFCGTVTDEYCIKYDGCEFCIVEQIVEILKSAANTTNKKTKAEEMEKIKKCPFCRGKAGLKEIKGFDRQVVSAYVFCQDCEASTRNYTTANAAIEAWNRRCCG